MNYLTFVVFLVQFAYTVNQETGCGCSVDRSKDGGDTQGSFFGGNKNEGGSQCTKESCGKSAGLLPESEIVLIPSGKYQFGTDDVLIETDKEGPKRIEKLENFYIDKYEVSNSDFSKFVAASNYKTEAETFGDSFVFTLFLNSTFKEHLKDFRVAQAVWWYKVQGADWKHPHGPDSNIEDKMDHPVIHVSWNDAVAFCSWREARLPTEREWEAACRGGHHDTKYPWGNKLFPDKTYMANIWQGTFPNHNSAKDGFVGTNPVSIFPPNDFGLYNMAGNVWEWTADVWAKDTPSEKVKKGGSYLCHRSYCFRYRCSARSHNTGDSSAGNLGFRCAKSL